jgi:hypothetical protein
MSGKGGAACDSIDLTFYPPIFKRNSMHEGDKKQ